MPESARGGGINFFDPWQVICASVQVLPDGEMDALCCDPPLAGKGSQILWRLRKRGILHGPAAIHAVPRESSKAVSPVFLPRVRTH